MDFTKITRQPRFFPYAFGIIFVVCSISLQLEPQISRAKLCAPSLPNMRHRAQKLDKLREPGQK
jgi:hypothetical protein